MALTGARAGEVLGLRWEWVDFDRTCLRLPDSKTGAKVIHLNPPALALLRELPRHGKNPHVLTGEKIGAHLSDLKKVWRSVRKAAALNDVRLHDLRHSYASMAAGAGFSLPVIGALLGHATPTATARYSHLAADPLKQATTRIGTLIENAMAGRKGRAKVLPLKR